MPRPLSRQSSAQDQVAKPTSDRLTTDELSDLPPLQREEGVGLPDRLVQRTSHQYGCIMMDHTVPQPQQFPSIGPIQKQMLTMLLAHYSPDLYIDTARCTPVKIKQPRLRPISVTLPRPLSSHRRPHSPTACLPAGGRSFESRSSRLPQHQTDRPQASGAPHTEGFVRRQCLFSPSDDPTPRPTADAPRLIYSRSVLLLRRMGRRASDTPSVAVPAWGGEASRPPIGRNREVNQNSRRCCRSWRPIGLNHTALGPVWHREVFEQLVFLLHLARSENDLEIVNGLGPSAFLAIEYVPMSNSLLTRTVICKPQRQCAVGAVYMLSICSGIISSSVREVA
jgi:hypothetical protein